MEAKRTASDDSTKLRVAVIGCGAIGQHRHIPEAFANPDVELVALCDVNEQRARDVAAKFGGPEVFVDHAAMLKAARADVVIVGTPNALHAPQSIAALDAGAHVLVEKPIATTLDEARAMIAAAERNGRFLMVGQNQRLMAAHVKAKRILDSGELGRPLSFQTTFKHAGPEGWSVDGAASWFFKKPLAAMGVCGDLGVHKVDLIQYLLGQRVVSVGGFIGTASKTTPDGRPIDVDDTAFLSVRTEAGVIGTITVSWTHYGNYEDNGTTIYCEGGVLSINENPEFPLVVHGRDGTKSFHRTGAVATNANQVKSGVIDSFVDSIRANRKPLIDGTEGLQALGVILAAFEAARTQTTKTV